MYNILTEPLILIAKSGGPRVEVSLPEVYAALVADEVDAFPALRPHQRHAWHAFLVQLGAIAMHQESVSEPPKDAETWAGLIRGLTSDFPEDEPWQLVVEDITRPAFMQPPASSTDKLADYKNTVATPDELDMLVTSKNHDLKAAVASSAEIDDWVFALITLQTMDGNPGRNPGISRMNGGHGNRPAFSITPSARPGIHIRRDVGSLLESREGLLDTHPMDDDGIRLIWTRPWNGTKSLQLRYLDPFYIEVCRLIRLRATRGNRLYAIKATAKVARIEAKALKGRTGDPWTPVNAKEGKSLTLARDGFMYKRTVDYLTSSDWQQPLLLKPTYDEGRSSDTMQLVARGMVRGQGKTEGYYERIIPIGRKLGAAMWRRAGTGDFGEIANSRIEEVSRVQRILSDAIQVFLARGDSDKASPAPPRLARPWFERLDAFVDATFFEDLQAEFEAEGDDERQRIRNKWLMDGRGGVVDRARRILGEAEDSLPCPSIERYKARVVAGELFEGRIRGNKGLPFLFTAKGDDNDD